MSLPLLTTKLRIPPPRPAAVPRPQLAARLSAGLHRRLTLIAAPAGFGKTSLLSAWAAGCGRPAAWLALDPADSDPARFLAYLVAALQTAAPLIGAGLTGLLQSPQPPPIDALLPSLLNDLDGLTQPAILVLDDYHLLESPPVDAALATLVEHLPPQLHLVIASREDPPLPLARLRARGQLTELRAADLRFSPAEAAAFLTRVMGLALAPAEVAALTARTEGWAAGLQLAALALLGSDDPAAAIAAFGGGHRFVLDYLLEEVLHRQPAHIQAFLLQTSILDRLCGDLCDAVLDDRRPSEGAPERALAASRSSAALEQLERANLFLISLDAERRWYRYHQLFAELLRQRLRQAQGAAAIAELHRRASAWHEAQGDALAAFSHAAAADDVALAARLIGGQGTPLHFRGTIYPVLSWAERLPPATLAEHPELRVIAAEAATLAGRPRDTVEAQLRAAEAALPAEAADPATRDLIGRIAVTRAMLAIPQSQVADILAQSRRALALLRPENLPLRATASWALGLARQIQGERAAAARAFADALAASQAVGNTMITLAAATCLGQLSAADTRLGQAEARYRQVIDLLGDPPAPYACEAYLGLARIAYARDELGLAEQRGRQSLELAGQLANVDTPVLCEVLLAQVRLARDDLAGAAGLLDKAERRARQRGFLHRLPDIAALQVRLLLRQGRPAAALARAEDRPLCQARAHLALGDPAAALALIAAARREAEAAGWQDAWLAATLLLAVAHDAAGQAGPAASALAAALDIAAPERIIRPFIDEGPPMARLLEKMQDDGGTMSAYRTTLLAAFAPGPQPAAPAPQPFIEPLSARERQILQLIAAGLSNQQIAERLILAESTVKGYNRNLFGKLQVQRRTEAVARARELGLI